MSAAAPFVRWPVDCATSDEAASHPYHRLFHPLCLARIHESRAAEVAEKR